MNYDVLLCDQNHDGNLKLWWCLMLKFIFLVGRTLIDEQNFYSFIDSRLLYLLNQLGAKIDNRNYDAIKNDI